MNLYEWFAHTQYSRWPVCIIVIWWIGAACGCAPIATSPDTLPTTGIVTLDGVPLGGADISFFPISDQSEIGGGYATSNDDGSYEASIFIQGGKSTKLGLPTGEYHVEIVKLEHVTNDASLSKPPRNILPARYSLVRSSGLKATVNSDSKNQNDFHLKK